MPQGVQRMDLQRDEVQADPIFQLCEDHLRHGMHREGKASLEFDLKDRAPLPEPKLELLVAQDEPG